MLAELSFPIPLRRTFYYLLPEELELAAAPGLRALASLYDEAGDAIDTANAAGIAFLKANIEAGLNAMAAASPQEIAAAVVTIPEGQDIVNNGIAVEITLLGIPIIRQISLHAKYVYSGSAFDSRLSA